MTSTESGVSRFLMGSAAFVIVVAGMKMAEALLVPFMLSVFIALICSPLLVWMKARSVPAILAILLIIFGVILVGLVMGAVVGASINDFRHDIPLYQDRLQGMLAAVLKWLAGRGINLDMAQIKSGFDPGAVMLVAGNALASLGNVMTNAFLILLTVVFILAEEMGFAEKLARARGNPVAAMTAIRHFTSSVNRYLAIKSLLSLLTGVLIMIWLWIIGVDFPVMWGMLAFLLNFVPTVGSIIAAVPALLLALIQLGPFSASLTLVGYLVANVLVGNILEPRMMGRGLNLSPLVVFLSLVFWGWVLGPVGMLLSIPLTIMVKIALDSDGKTRWISIMLGNGEPGAGSPLDLTATAGSKDTDRSAVTGMQPQDEQLTERPPAQSGG